MNSLLAPLKSSPILARVVPFVVFLGLTALQGTMGEASRYWLYLAKTFVGGWLLWTLRDVIREMKWAVSCEAVAAGLAVFVIWVGLDGLVPTQQEAWVKLGFSKPPETPAPQWNPFVEFGEASALAWLFIAVRVLGSSIVVPPLEEVFYRSFLYRWIANPNFESEPLGRFAWKPLVVMSLLFGLAHNEWLAGVLCAVIYQGLILRKKRLGDAITAHAITNLLLGTWVVWKGAWNFW